MDATGLALLGGSDEDLGTIGFDDDPTEALARLTNALESEPEVAASYSMTSSGTPVTVYRWGGLLLQVGLRPADPDEHHMGANFVEPYLGAIRLVGPEGVSVGDPMGDVPAPITVGSYEGTPNGPRYLLGEPSPLILGDEVYAEYVQGFDTAAEPWNAPSTGILVELMAPVASYGGPSWKRFGTGTP
ncbi:MAG: hypothetical protein JWR04_740 [Rhodoglobus sp.]|nr:hypothetical protein [Rhodoglobus sp.]